MLNNFQTPSLLLGLFLRKLEVPDYKTFAESLPWRLPELDADPVFNNVPQNAPPDVPRVRFMSKDTRVLLEVAPQKLHFRMMPGAITTNPQGQPNVQALTIDAAFEGFIPQVMRVHTVMSEHFGATATRVGVVTDIIAAVPSSANQRIQKHFLSGKNLLGDRLQELQIVASARAQLPGGANINRRITVRPLRTGAAGNPDLLLGINIDVNTLPEEPYDISTTDLESFLRGTYEHLKNDVPLFNERALFE